MPGVKKISKAVIPAAGLGTRFLPATKAQPKEMLPIVDKPTIQYVVEEAVAAGIEDILIITGRGKRAIEDHFDYCVELEALLSEKERETELQMIRAIPEMAQIYYVRQKEPLGLGHAIFCARKFIGQEPFAVLLGDDLIAGEVPCIGQLMSVYAEKGGTVLGVQPVDRQAVHKYGIVESAAAAEDEVTGGRFSCHLKPAVQPAGRQTTPNHSVAKGAVEKGYAGEGNMEQGRFYRESGFAGKTPPDMGKRPANLQQPGKSGMAEGTAGEGRLYRVKGLVEKPSCEKAPSNLAVLGRYVLEPEIFAVLERTKPGTGGEIQLTDALHELAATRPVWAYSFKGKRYDVGDKMGFLQATIEYALDRPDLSHDLVVYLHNLMQKDPRLRNR